MLLVIDAKDFVVRSQKDYMLFGIKVEYSYHMTESEQLFCDLIEERGFVRGKDYWCEKVYVREVAV